MTEADFDLYDTLNVPRDASTEDVRAAFRDLSRLYHPDKQAASPASPSRPRSGGTAGGEAAFMRVHRAYRVLGDDVLRSFYDKYGLSGIRLAEALSDDEGEAGAGRQIGMPEDRLKHLEERVRRKMLKHEELRVQRLLALQGSFVLSLASAPGPHGTHLRRRYCLQYTAVSQSMQVSLGERLRLTAGCAAHVQGANGFGAAKLMLAAISRFNSATSGRCALTFAGSVVEGEANLNRHLSPNCVVQQKLSVSADRSCTLTLGLQPWLSDVLQGSLECVCGEQTGLSFGLVRRSSASRHKLSASLRLQPGAGEIGVHAKLKPSKDFSLTVSPGLSPKGWVLGLDCSKAARDGLTKLHWILRLRQRGASLRLGFSRAGLRFAIPVELWPESAGALPLSELCFAVAIWAVPPLVLRLLVSSAHSFLEWCRPTSQAEVEPLNAPASPSATSVPPAQSAAEEQRQLLVPVAEKKRREEASRGGLEILSARYGDPQLVMEEGQNGCLDVTDCLMAWVRGSRLDLSDAPKSALIGFHDRATDGGPPSVLCIRYRFGSTVHTRSFGDTEAVHLP